MLTSVLHPLQHKWILYCDKYFTNVFKVAECHTVESFWQVFNNIPTSSTLQHKWNYRWFKEPIKPASEAPENVEGGQWIISGLDTEQLDAVVFELLLAAIGHQFIPQVNGLVINVRRKGHRVGIWTAYGGTDQRQNELGLHVRQLVHGIVPDATPIQFKLHKGQPSAYMAQVLLEA